MALWEDALNIDDIVMCYLYYSIIMCNLLGYDKNTCPAGKKLHLAKFGLNISEMILKISSIRDL